MDLVPWMGSVRGNPHRYAPAITPVVNASLFDDEKFSVNSGDEVPWANTAHTESTINLKLYWGGRQTWPTYGDASVTYTEGRLFLLLSRSVLAPHYRSRGFATELNEEGQPVRQIARGFGKVVHTRLPHILARFRELVAKSPEALRVMGLADYMKLTSLVRRGTL